MNLVLRDTVSIPSFILSIWKLSYLLFGTFFPVRRSPCKFEHLLPLHILLQWGWQRTADTQFNEMDSRTGLLLLIICWAGEVFVWLWQIFICVIDVMYKMHFIFIWQVLMVRLWHSLNPWLKGLENLTHWPVQPLDSHSAATACIGSDRLLEKDWSGLLMSDMIVA